MTIRMESQDALRQHQQVRLPLLVSKRDAAELLSLCVRTIDNLIATKRLPSRRIGKRVLIPYAALVHFARHDQRGGA
jgi:excisionase family DNA binding protein